MIRRVLRPMSTHTSVYDLPKTGSHAFQSRDEGFLGRPLRKTFSSSSSCSTTPRVFYFITFYERRMDR